MLNVGKIVGFPVKIFGGNQVYIPKEYLRYYGISEKKDRLILTKSEHDLFYRPLPGNGTLYTKKETISIRVGLTPLPAGWVRRNKLNRGDIIFLLGMKDGMLLTLRK